MTQTEIYLGVGVFFFLTMSVSMFIENRYWIRRARRAELQRDALQAVANENRRNYY